MFFASTFARTYLARRLVKNATNQDWEGKLIREDDMTFADHANVFGSDLDLLLLGSEIESGSVGRFGSYATPSFEVADAVRISLGIPFAFEPVRIERRSLLSSEYRCGSSPSSTIR